MRFLCSVLLIFVLISSVAPQYVIAQSRGIAAERLAARAHVIAVGKVAEVRSEWASDKKTIQTKVVIAVDEFVKGSADGSTMTVYVPGGEVGRVGELYTHMPTFKPDEDVVVFAERDKQNQLRVSGGTNGKFVIKRDEATGMPLVAGLETRELFVSRIKSTLNAPKSRP